MLDPFLPSCFPLYKVADPYNVVSGMVKPIFLSLILSSIVSPADVLSCKRSLAGFHDTQHILKSFRGRKRQRAWS